MKKVFVVILNWNRPEDTIECLSSVERLQSTDYSLNTVVVDNASENISKLKSQISKLQFKSKNLRIIENKRNLGYAGGNNVGIKYALKNGTDYVMVLNNDTIVEGNLLIELLEVFENNPKVGIASPKIYFAKGFEFHKERYKKENLGNIIWYAGGKIDWDNVYGSGRGVDEVDKGQFNETQETDYATGTCMLLNKEALEKIGLFDEKYFMYYEDTDLSIRARKAGYKILYVPKAFLWHKVAQSSAIGSGLNDYYTTRNRMLFGLRYASMRTKFALLRESVKLLLIGRKWQKIGIRDYYLGRFDKGSWK